MLNIANVVLYQRLLNASISLAAFCCNAGNSVHFLHPVKSAEDAAQEELSMSMGLAVQKVSKLLTVYQCMQVPSYALLQVGLVISAKQPWLCCSPDGIINFGDSIHLVEIKCPYSLQDSILIDHMNQISFVPYIHYINGHLTLKSTHAYFTQVQLMLYILMLNHAFFFVYSSKQSITIHVDRDNSFLAEYPKNGIFLLHTFFEMPCSELSLCPPLKVSLQNDTHTYINKSFVRNR